MKVLNVRLTDEEHLALKTRAAVVGGSVTDLVKGWIGTLQTPIPELDPIRADIAVAEGERIASSSASSITPLIETHRPSFLAAPIDECARPECGHDRQTYHVGTTGACVFAINRRQCQCPGFFEGF